MAFASRRRALAALLLAAAARSAEAQAPVPAVVADAPSAAPGMIADAPSPSTPQAPLPGIVPATLPSTAPEAPLLIPTSAPSPAAATSEKANSEVDDEFTDEGAEDPDIEAKAKGSDYDKLKDLTEGGRGNGSYYPTPEGKATGLMLVGNLIFVMVLYYATNWFQRMPRLFAWKMISSSMAIFIALLSWQTIEKLMKATFPSVDERKIMVTCFIVLYTSVITSMYFVTSRKLTLHSLAKVGGHMVGFAAISVFESMTKRYVGPGNNSYGWMCITIIVFSTIIIGLQAVGTIVRLKLIRRVDDSNEEWHDKAREWQAVCIEAEDEAVTLSYGLLLSQGVRFLILGELPPIRGSPADRDPHHIRYLLYAGLFTLVMLVVFTYLMKRIYNTQRKLKMELLRNAKKLSATLESGKQKLTTHTLVLNSSLMQMKPDIDLGTAVEKLQEQAHMIMPRKRIYKLIQGTIAMLAAWIMIFWSQWAFTAAFDQDRMVMKTVLAVLTSAVVFPILVLFSMKCAARNIDEFRAFEVVLVSMGLLVGLMWEKAFDFALSKIIIGEHSTGTGADYPGYCLRLIASCIVMDLICAPAWIAFVLPKANPWIFKGLGGATALWGEFREDTASEDEHPGGVSDDLSDSDKESKASEESEAEASD